MAAAVPILIKAAGSLLLSAAAQALSPKPKQRLTASGRMESIRSPIAPRRIIYGRARVGGVITYAQNTGLNNVFLTMLLTLSGHPLDAIEEYYLADQLVTVSGGIVQTFPWTNVVTMVAGTGTPAGDAGLLHIMQASPTWTNGVWNAAVHRQEGCGKLGVNYVWGPGLYPSGAPRASVVVRGRKVFDPRDGGQSYADPSTWLWSQNATLCQTDYLAGYMLDAHGEREPIGLGATEDEVDWDQVIASANIDDEAVALAAGGTEARYTCNGVIEGGSHGENLKQLSTANWGKLLWTSGKFFQVSGAYRTPAITITLNDLLSDIEVQPRLSRRDLINTMQASYVSPAHSWQPTDAPAYQSPVGLAEDEEEKRLASELPFTTSVATAQRISKIAVLANRQQVSCAITIKPELGLQVIASDTVEITLAVVGWTSKVFEVERWGMVFLDGSDGPFLAVRLELRETDASVYDWTTVEEVGVDPAPDSEFKSPALVDPPTDLVIAESKYSTLGLGVKAKVTLSWAASPDAFLQDYQVEWRPSEVTPYLVAGRTTDTTFDILDVAPATYDFRVVATNILEARSEPVEDLEHQISGLSDTPADVTGLTVQAIGGHAVLRWDEHPDLDVREGGLIVFRHTPDLVAPVWEASATIGEAVPGGEVRATLPLKPGTYLVKAQDSTEQVSSAAASAQTDGQLAQGFGAVSQIDEHPGFLGIHTGTAAPDGVLKLDGTLALDDWDDVDAVSDWDSWGGLGTSGTYDFAAGFDFGALSAVRLRSILNVVAVNALDLMDDWEGLLDAREDFDGDAGVPVDAWVEVRVTPDDPAGAPTWGPWNRIESAEYLTRGVDPRAQLRSYDPSYTLHIDELSLKKEAAA